VAARLYPPVAGDSSRSKQRSLSEYREHKRGGISTLATVTK
jgi:hypothetical protein